jgi:hypothetical protein
MAFVAEQGGCKHYLETIEVVAPVISVIASL